MSLSWREIEDLRARVPLSYRPWDQPESPIPAHTHGVPTRPAPKPQLNPTPGIFGRSVEAAPLASELPYSAGTLKDHPVGGAEPREADADRKSTSNAAARDEEKRAAHEAALKREEANRTLNNASAVAAESGQVRGFRLAPGWNLRFEERKQQTEKKKEADQKFALDQARKALLERLRQLDEQIAELDRRIKELDRQIEAYAALKALRDRGVEIDPADASHRELMRQAGMSASDARRANEDPSYLDHQMGQREEERNEKLRSRKEKEHQRAVIQQEADKLDAQAKNPDFKMRLQRQTQATGVDENLADAVPLAKSQEAKDAVIGAIAANAPARSETKNYGRLGLESITKVASASGKEFDFDTVPQAFPNAPPVGEAFTQATQPPQAPRDLQTGPARLPTATL